METFVLTFIMPTNKDRTFVPYPLGADPKFEKCLPDTEAQEGVPWESGPAPARGFSDDAHDPGGKTEEGLIQSEYNIWRKQWGLPVAPVRNLTKDEERTIYYVGYWMPYGPMLPAGLDLAFFDLDVNGGGKRAIITLQRAIGIADDGGWGPETDDAVKKICAGSPSLVIEVIDSYYAKREEFYEGLHTFQYFGKGWTRRSKEITAEAEAMEKPA